MTQSKMTPRIPGMNRNSILPPSCTRMLSALVAQHGVTATAALLKTSTHVVEELTSGGRTTFRVALRLEEALRALEQSTAAGMARMR